MTALAPPPLPADLVAGLRRLKLASMRAIAPELSGHRQNPALEPRGLPAHPRRRRDHQPRRLQRQGPPQSRQLPGHQTPRRVRCRHLVDPARHLRLPGLPGVDPRRRESGSGRPRGHRKEPRAGRFGSRRGRRRPPSPLLLRRRASRHPLPRTGRQQRRAGHRDHPARRLSSSSTNSASPRSTTPAPNCCSASSPPPTNAAAWASPATGPSRNGDASYPNTPPPAPCSTGYSTTPTSSSPKATATACAKPEPEEVPPLHQTLKHPVEE